jgi:hypothetical protein
MASAETILPEGFRLKSASGTLTISWRGPTHWVFLFAGTFGLALCGILLAGFALTSRVLSGAPLLFGAGLLFSAYVLLVGLCNRTCISICECRLQARHGPLPCLLPSIFQVGCTKGIPIDEVEELRVEAEPQDDSPDTDPPTYALRAVVRDGSVQTLLTGMELFEARSVGQVLADSAGLVVSVPEETPRVGAVCQLRRH